jgi:hypothetical protein
LACVPFRFGQRIRARPGRDAFVSSLKSGEVWRRDRYKIEYAFKGEENTKLKFILSKSADGHYRWATGNNRSSMKNADSSARLRNPDFRYTANACCRIVVSVVDRSSATSL